MDYRCCGVNCDSEPTYMRRTQFAGNHPYCTLCAAKEDDFLEEDSTFFWVEIAELACLNSQK